MQTFKTPNQKVYAKFKKNKMALFSLGVIILICVVAIFSFFITPDKTPNANIQNPSIAMQNPGFNMLFLKIKKDGISNRSWLEAKFNGKDLDYKLIALTEQPKKLGDKFIIKEFK